VARAFLSWLHLPLGRVWLDVGCGTGALSATVLEAAAPAHLLGVDRSPGYLAYARVHLGTAGARAAFAVADALALPLRAGAVDAVVSGLVLNFVPDPARAVAEMARVARTGAAVALYVWDYAGQMQLMRSFWDAATALDPAAAELDEGRRFSICRPDRLIELFWGAGLRDVEARAIDVPTDFRDFDDYWSPFLGGQGTAPSYAMSLDEERRAALRERIRAALPTAPDGSIHLIARAWAVRGWR
jgi:SAM-dependent methyltransferase